MVKKYLRGTFTAMVTPFKYDGSVDYDGFCNNLEAQIKAGASPVILGTTGEAPQIEREERKSLTEIAVKEAQKHSLPIVVGVTSESYKEMIHYAEGAAKQGANYILATPTPYVKQQQEDIVQMYTDLTGIGIPIIVYNIKSRIGVNIETSTLKKMAELENIVAVKEASGDLKQMKDVIDTVVADRPEFSVLSGDDSVTYPLLELGGDGVVSVVSNLVPERVVEMVQSYLSGEKENARKIDEKLQPLYEAAFIEGNPKSIKGLMRLAGLPSGMTRRPLYGLREETESRLKKALSEFGLLKSRGVIDPKRIIV